MPFLVPLACRTCDALRDERLVWFYIIGLLLLCPLWLDRYLLKSERVPNGLTRALTRCPTCKYSLDGLPETGLCPECGVLYDREPMGFTVIRSLRPGRIPAILAAVAVLAMIVLLGVFGRAIIIAWMDLRYDSPALTATLRNQLRNGHIAQQGDLLPTLAPLVAAAIVLVGTIVNGRRLGVSVVIATPASIALSLLAARLSIAFRPISWRNDPQTAMLLVLLTAMPLLTIMVYAALARLGLLALPTGDRAAGGDGEPLRLPGIRD